MCNMGALLVGVGLLVRQPRPLAVGATWLAVGDVLWALDLLSGSDLLPTSLLTHILGLAIGVIGLRRLGFPRGTWLVAGVAVLGLQEITRLLTPERSNVNVVFAMYGGAERIFSSHLAYRGSLIALAFVLFGVVEVAARRLIPAPAVDVAAGAGAGTSQRAKDKEH